MEDAFIWMTNNTNADDRTIILTDSLSLVSKLSTGRIKKNWFAILQSIQSRIEVIYIPGHAGIRFNERADWLAGKARPFGDLQLTQADVLRQVSEEIRTQEREQATFSLNRLYEGEVSAGAGARMRTRGKERSLATQITMGVLSGSNLRTLLGVLEGGGPVSVPAP